MDRRAESVVRVRRTSVTAPDFQFAFLFRVSDPLIGYAMRFKKRSIKVPSFRKLVKMAIETPEIPRWARKILDTRLETP